MKKVLMAIVGCLLIFVCGLLIAKLIHQIFLLGSKGESVTVSVPQVQSGPERVLDDEKLDREFRLKMLVFSFCGGSNTNRLAFEDLDLTGWDEVERKGGTKALEAFIKAAWKKADEKKIAAKQAGGRE